MQYLELTRIDGCDESSLVDNCQPFNIIGELLAVNNKTLILDLGATNNHNLDFFSEYRCKIYIEDIYHSMVDAIHKFENSDNEHCPDFDCLFFCREQKKIDVIFCWELLNYIPTKFLAEFIQSLRRFLKPAGFLHGFIATQAIMHTQVLDYRIVNAKTMQREESLTQERMKSPRYNQIALFKIMPEFKVIKSVLHQNGMQEYLFKFEPE